MFSNVEMDMDVKEVLAMFLCIYYRELVALNPNHKIITDILSVVKEEKIVLKWSEAFKTVFLEMNKMHLSFGMVENSNLTEELSALKSLQVQTAKLCMDTSIVCFRNEKMTLSLIETVQELCETVENLRETVKRSQSESNSNVESRKKRKIVETSKIQSHLDKFVTINTTSTSSNTIDITETEEEENLGSSKNLTSEVYKGFSGVAHAFSKWHTACMYNKQKVNHADVTAWNKCHSMMKFLYRFLPEGAELNPPIGYENSLIAGNATESQLADITKYHVKIRSYSTTVEEELIKFFKKEEVFNLLKSQDPKLKHSTLCKPPKFWSAHKRAQVNGISDLLPAAPKHCTFPTVAGMV